MSPQRYMPWRCPQCLKMRAPNCRPEFFENIRSIGDTLLKRGYRCAYCVENDLAQRPYAALYSVHEASEVLGVSKQSVRNWIREGSLKAARMGRAFKVSPESLEEALGPLIMGLVTAEDFEEKYSHPEE